ncbi:MAG TPA: MmgE/PrpD family protein [Castellaniella sp.]|uniref:MmgE/PrpD family protein n=1 Tax=Castellaniella sp. TaxID=1955812 RepID=UPI002EED7CAC
MAIDRDDSPDRRQTGSAENVVASTQNCTEVARFILGLQFEDIPAAVISQARRCLLDLSGVAAAAVATPLSAIVRNHVAHNYGAATWAARMLFDGRKVSLPGAALAGATMIDSLDAHDGHVLTKGHVGVTILPVLAALADSGLITDDRSFLTSLVLGYEIATRAGIALHATACDYHTSGAWNALGAAALTARALNLPVSAVREALGSAEYFGPRSQMMRCIDHPTMVKDGSGWGAMTGVSAALLAADGFTGAPAVTMESDAAVPFWQDLGERWAITEQYFKPYPVCRWAQPAVEAIFSLSRDHEFNASDVDYVRVTSFREACRLATRHPTTTEQAQYSLPFSVAIALVRGRLGAAEVTGDALTDPTAWRISDRMVLQEDERYNRLFPAQRWAEVEVVLRDGTRLHSAPHTARGDAEAPLGDAEIMTKFGSLAEPVLGAARCDRLTDCVDRLGRRTRMLSSLVNELVSAAG